MLSHKAWKKVCASPRVQARIPVAETSWPQRRFRITGLHPGAQRIPNTPAGGMAEETRRDIHRVFSFLVAGMLGHRAGGAVVVANLNGVSSAAVKGAKAIGRVGKAKLPKA